MKLDDVKPAEHSESAPLAIIGIGCLFPGAENQSAYWANIREGLDAISEIPATHWNPADYHDPDPKSPDHTYGRRGGFISPFPFNPLEYNIPPNTLEAIDTSQLLGLVVAGQALKDAGYGLEKAYDRGRVSVILGVTGAMELVIPLGARLGHPIWRTALKDAGVDDKVAEDVVQRIADGYVPWQENSFPGLLGNVVAGRISKQYDLGGTNCVVDAACASSFSALHLAGMELSSGKADMVVTGGIDTFNDIFMYMCFSKTPALSPTGNAKPFDAAGDGTILGEGLGIVVIKRLADAERDGDRIYAVIKGVGSSSDGKGDAIYAPSAEGQKRALLDAYQRAGVTPESIGLVEAHGTGTKVGDAVEVSALREVYGESDRPWCALGSVKSQIGHTKAAAGAAGLIKAALALHHKVIPPTIKVEQPLNEVINGKTPFYLATEKRPWLRNGRVPRRAGVSAFGFGGSNFHTVLEEYLPAKEKADWDGNTQLIAFSADSAASLEEQLSQVNAGLAWVELREFAASSRKRFRSADPFRLAIVVEREKTNLGSVIKNCLSMLKGKPAGEWSTPDGAYFSSGKSAGELGVLFPGQGSQYTGMLLDLACCFPEMLASLEAAEDGFHTSDGTRLSDRIYPCNDFSSAAAGHDEALLRATETAQPAIGAVSLGALKVLESFGFHAAAAGGHSYGELTALCAAGRLDEAALHDLSRLRGTLMGSGTGDKGGMLAVPAPLSTVEKIVAEEELNLVIANRNAPAQAVLSGSSAEIDRAAVIFTGRSLSCKKLPVAAAFHSPLVADAAAPFLEALAGIELQPGVIPVYANSTASIYPDGEQAAKELLAGQLAQPVEFVAEIEAMYSAGIRIFAEVGPGARLTGLVRAILGDRPHVALALDSSAGKRPGMVDLARFIAQLAALGQDLDLSLWDEGFEPPLSQRGKKPAMTIPICGANYVQPRAKRSPSAPVKTGNGERGTGNGENPVSFNQNLSQSSPVSRDALAESLKVTRESISILQKMQEETARLHRMFLEGQEAAGRTFQSLLENQNRLLQGELPAPIQFTAQQAAPPVPAAAAVAPSPGPVAAIVTPSPQPVKPAAGPDTSAVLLAVVSEKTGYPIEMLDLDMGMDADLGIDSIKRVEILSALQEKLPGSPLIGPEQLGSLLTLGDIAAFLGDNSSVGSPLAVPASAVQGASSNSPAADIAATLFGVVSEKTGYPVEMLDLEMGMDADLGIDSIKRVEILSALQSALPAAPVIGPEQLGSLRTLGDIAAYLGKGVTSGATAGATLAAPVATVQVTAISSTAVDTAATLLAVVSERTGYPAEMLDLEMGMDADLGIDSIKRVEILSALQERLPGAPLIGPEQLGSLRTLGDIAAFLGASAPASPAETAATPTEAATPAVTTQSTIARSTIVAVAAELPADEATLQVAQGGEFWITDDGGHFSAELYSILKSRGLQPRLIADVNKLEITSSTMISGLVLAAPEKGTDDQFLENAFLLMKKAAPALSLAGSEGGGAIFATVSRLDGGFGCIAGSEIVDPLSGGLSGLAKTAGREWPDVVCKALDLGRFNNSSEAAAAVADELFRSSAQETGLMPGSRTALSLEPLPAAEKHLSDTISKDDVIIITGGGRGVTAATAVALANAGSPLLLLVGRSPAPAEEPDWLQNLQEEPRIKRAILEQAGGKLHPREIEERYQAVIAGRELRSTLADIEAAGGRAIYRAVDIRDGGAVAALLSEIRSTCGPIRGIVHGAGVLADRLIADKSREQFAFVYSTKVAGLRSLLSACQNDDLRFIALFSSTTGRFGRSGQVDYAVANEVLNKLAQVESRRRPSCRTVSINWGPWDGGMVTPALKKVFAGEGIGLISLASGGEFLVREISDLDGPVEVVALATSADEVSSPAPSRQKSLTEAHSLTLNITDYPFLRSHVIDSKAVLPMALIVEWLAHSALHGNPGLKFHGFNDLRICKGVVFEQNNTCRLHLMAGRAEKRESFYLVPVELTSSCADNRTTLHARAEIVLASRLPEGIRSIKEMPLSPYHPHNGQIYDHERLFHGPDLQGIRQIDGCSEKGISAVVSGAPQPAAWIKNPLRGNWLTDPLVLDSAFQMMILWSFERFGSGSLPCFAGRYRQFLDSFPKDEVQVAIRITAERAHGANADIEFLDCHTGKLVARLEDYECVIDPSLGKAFQRNQLAQGSKTGSGAA